MCKKRFHNCWRPILHHIVLHSCSSCSTDVCQSIMNCDTLFSNMVTCTVCIDDTFIVWQRCILTNLCFSEESYVSFLILEQVLYCRQTGRSLVRKPKSIPISCEPVCPNRFNICDFFDSVTPIYFWLDSLI